MKQIPQLFLFRFYSSAVRFDNLTITPKCVDFINEYFKDLKTREGDALSTLSKPTFRIDARKVIEIDHVAFAGPQFMFDDPQKNDVVKEQQGIIFLFDEESWRMLQRGSVVDFEKGFEIQFLNEKEL